jgi:hypothetical protein
LLLHIFNSKGLVYEAIIGHSFCKEQEIFILTLSRTLLSIRPPNECPHETTMASSRNEPLKHR